jgi:LacI family transcriptional regulator
VAAEMLEMMMAGQNPDPLIQVVTPIGISTRQSTDVFAIEDVNLVKALRFIREHACRGISVDEVARVAGLARRTMEARFKKMLDRSPHEEIMRIQVMRAQRLLLYSNLPIALIAERVGFETPEYFSVAFKRITGMPPVTYRKKRGEVR